MRPSLIVLVVAALTVARRADADPSTERAPITSTPHAEWWARCAPPEADGEIRLSTGCSGVFGTRGTLTSVRGASASAGAGMLLSSEGEEFVRRGLFNAHGSHRLAIGGGAGLDGTLQMALAAGTRIPVAERHGPVLRGGGAGYVRGNDAYYGSLLELPQVQIGYQFMRGITVFELGATTGIVLTGRERAGDVRWRRLEGIETGAYVAAQIPWVRFGARVVRVPTHDALERSVDIVEGTLCGMVTPFAICADARGMRTDAILSATGERTEVASFYSGITLGVTRER